MYLPQLTKACVADFTTCTPTPNYTYINISRQELQPLKIKLRCLNIPFSPLDPFSHLKHLLYPPPQKSPENSLFCF